MATASGRPSRTRQSSATATTSTGPQPKSVIRKPSISVDHTTTSSTRKLNLPWGTTATHDTPSKPLWNSTKPTPSRPSLLSKRSTSTLVPTNINGNTNKLAVPTTNAASERNRKSSLLSISSASTVALGEDRQMSGTGEKRHVEVYDPEKEPIKTYLRIRPAPEGVPTATYIEILNPTEVAMIPPANHRLNTSNTYSSLVSDPLLRSPLDEPPSPSFPASSSLYTFTRVSPSTESQSSFFTHTTLPLVHEFLAGQNCLLFAYGPTGSGKTWTVQGGTKSEKGLLPRVLEVVWKSLEGKESGDEYRPNPNGQGSVQISPPTPDVRKKTGPQTSTPAKGATGLGIRQSLLEEALKGMSEEEEVEAIPVEEGYEYSIWVSYAEIYNEKIYDLLESPLPTPTPSASSATSSSGGGSSMFSKVAKAIGLKSFQTVKRNALSLKHDKDGGNKYVAGMKEVRIHGVEDAHNLLERGQLNRRVFSTLANRASSRSHSIFTIKIIKSRKDGMEAPQTSRFSIVDLAGSERVVNTQTTGERLKEAGNINKSLMVLGQCMETLRKNQEREKGRKPALVPFRHSKLTEIFQSFFVGDGKAVMIVNVNPHDTGFDENSHVMKFSAVAKGVMTIQDKTPRVLPIAPAPVTPKEPRVVRLSMVDGGEEEDFIYEEEDAEEEEEEEDDQFVNALLDEITFLRKALRDQSIETVMAASKAKASTVREYELKILETERHYQNLLREEALEAEVKLNAKLDILSRHQTKQPTPGTPSQYDDSDEEEEEEEEEVSLAEEDDEGVSASSEGDASVEVEKMLLEEGDSMRSLANSPAAQAGKRSHNRTASLEMDSPVPKGAGSKLHQSFVAPGVDDEEDEESEEGSDEEDDGAVEAEDSDAFSEPEEEEVSEEEYAPAPRKSNTTRATRQSTAARKTRSPAKVVVDVEVEVKTKGRAKSAAKLALSESTNSIPEADEEPDFEKSMVVSSGGKKKPKRKLGGGKMKNAEDIDNIAEAFTPIVKSASNRSIISNAASIRSLKY